MNKVVRVVGRINKVSKSFDSTFYQISDKTGSVWVSSKLDFRVGDRIGVVGKVTVGNNNMLYISSNQVNKLGYKDPKKAVSRSTSFDKLSSLAGRKVVKKKPVYRRKIVSPP